MRAGCSDHHGSVPYTRYVPHIWSGACIFGRNHITHRRYRHRNGLDYANLALVHRIPLIIHLLKNACIFTCWKDIQILYQLYSYPIISKGVRLDKKWLWTFQEAERNRIFWRGAFGFWDSRACTIEFHKYPLTLWKVLFKTFGVRKWGTKKPLLPDTAVLPNCLPCVFQTFQANEWIKVINKHFNLLSTCYQVCKLNHLKHQEATIFLLLLLHKFTGENIMNIKLKDA